MIISDHRCFQQLLNFYLRSLSNRIFLCISELLIVPYKIEVFSRKFSINPKRI